MTEKHIRPSYGAVARAAENAMAAPFGMADMVWLTQINQAINSGDYAEHETPITVAPDLRERLDLERAVRALYINPETKSVSVEMRGRVRAALGL